jgi:hypothetical protein
MGGEKAQAGLDVATLLRTDLQHIRAESRYNVPPQNRGRVFME